jgi:DNA replicative helicase MCM subunit Mcm2 (Cdc46/Mcm family)
MKVEDLLSKAKQFFEDYKKDMGKCIKRGTRTLSIPFQDISSFSPELAESILQSPEDLLQILELAIDEMGIATNARIRLTELPSSQYVKIPELKKKHFNQLIALEGEISSLGKVRHRVVNTKFECPSCGTIISVLQTGTKKVNPKRCSCGRNGQFREMSSDYEDYRNMTLAQEGETLFIHINESLLDSDSNEILKEGNIILVSGILKPQLAGDSREIEVILEANNIEPSKEPKQETGKEDINQLLEAMDPYQFESYAGKLFSNKGYSIEVTPKSGDMGIDVIAKKGAERIGIQCKKNARDIKVSNQVIQKALGAAVSPYRLTKLIVITTADEFTPMAIKQGEESKLPLELWNREKLIGEIEANMQNLEEGWNILNELEEKKRIGYPLQETDISIDIDKIVTGITASKRSRIIVVREALTRLESRLGKMIPIEELKKELEGKMDSGAVEETIEELNKVGDIFIPKKGYVMMYNS